MISAQSNLVLVGANTKDMQVFWKGMRVPNILGVKADWEDDEQRVKIRLQSLGVDSTMLAEMRSAGIVIKGVR